MDLVSDLQINSLSCVHNCLVLLSDGIQSYEVIVVRLESLLEAIRQISNESCIAWASNVIALLDSAVDILLREIERNTTQISTPIGRPRLQLPISTIEYLLSLKFSVPDVARILGVSRGTIFGRLRENGLSVAQSYTVITDNELNNVVVRLLVRFPNTGYKRMKGFLLNEGLKLTDQRVRSAMRTADPEGVYQRTMQNRCIVRRQYFVTYFNQLWHLDTNMKLIRWNIIIRGCIDGRTRLVTYLDASSDNTAETNLVSFLKAVSQYGIPSRTRSDKGGENVMIARFMIEQRGVDRSSHICGRSVHNQRIERYWRDVFYGFTSAIYNVLSNLEQDGFLDVDNPKHICLVHKVFIPRVNQHLDIFRNAWNNHPLSSEQNYTPTQLMVLHLPPPHLDIELGEAELHDIHFVCNRLEDLLNMEVQAHDTITSPISVHGNLDESELQRVSELNVLRESNSIGYDIFQEALTCLNGA